MVDINQWRASIGGWSCRCTSISWSVSNNKVKTNPTITDSVSILAGPATLSLVLVLVLLLVLSGDIELNPGPGSKPDAFDVFHFLKSHSSRWDEIGRDLKVDLNTRRKIEQGGQSTSTFSVERKLEEVIDHWIQSCCSEVTWDNLIEVLQELQMVSTAEEIECCLLNNEKMKKKYNWKRVNEVQLVEPMDSSSLRDFSTDVHTCTNSSSVVVDQTDLSSTSDHISQVPEFVQQFRRHSIGFYARIKTPAYHNKKPSPSITEFINLILVHQKKKKENKNDKIQIMEHKMKGDTEEIKKKPTLSINKIARVDSTDIKVIHVLIKGDPGVGKTTLAWELCKGWTEGRLLQKWNIVLLVQLRAKNIREANTLQSLIDPYNDPHMRGVYEYIQDNNGAGLMLIFDGFDELSDIQRQDSSFFMRLLRGEMLSEISIILTTRPSAMKLIPEVFINNLDQIVVIHGFEEKAIHRYIECKFKGNSDILEAFKAYVSSHHFIFSLLYVPLHCALITDLFEDCWIDESQIKFAPNSLTELYNFLICCLIWRNTGQRIESVSELSDDLKCKFTELARIAAMGIENKQFVFDAGSDIASVDEFGLLQRVEIANEYYGRSESYSFSHLTLQEYLAAYYWSITQKDVSNLFDLNGIVPVQNHIEHINSTAASFHWPVVLFYSGLTGLEGTPLEPIIKPYQLKDMLLTSLSSNYLSLLFESGNPNVMITAFAATGSIVKSKIKSSIEAYVTGYCIARADESVKWEIEMRESGLIKNLVHGIEHGKLENIKGSVIQKIHVSVIASKESLSEYSTSVFQFFDYLEKISCFLKKLNLMYNSCKHPTFQRNQAAAIYTFDLIEFSYCAINHQTSVGALLNILEYFKSLKTVSLSGSISMCITDTTIDEHGRVHLHYHDETSHAAVYCHPAFFRLQPFMSDVCISEPADYHFIQYVAVQQHPSCSLDNVCLAANSSFSFGRREYGYSLLPFKFKSLFNSVYNLFHNDTITDHQLPKVLVLCDQPHFCPTDTETVSFSIVT